MLNQETLTLMYKDYEVLTFIVDYVDRPKIRIIKELEHFDLAPYGVSKGNESNNMRLLRFFNSRKISENRWDYDLIIKNIGCRDSFELAFKGHGLSLSNHYWFKREGEDLKYDDINFFSNKWDDSFARAVLNGKYEELSKCDLNVPDIVTQGWSVKGWIYDNGPKLIKLGIVKDQYEDSLGEVLASRLASRILKEDEVLKYDLVKVNDKYGSICKPLVGIDEELVPLSVVLPNDLYELFLGKNNNKDKNREFFKRVSKFGMPELYELFVKISCIRSLCFVSDLHFDNICVIRNIKTGKLKPAPIHDLAGAFGTSRTGKEFITKLNKGSYFIIYFLFSFLESSWDYSWYDSTKLEGFEKEIRDILSKSNFYTPELIDRIIDVYKHQLEALNEISKKSVTL